MAKLKCVCKNFSVFQHFWTVFDAVAGVKVLDKRLFGPWEEVPIEVTASDAGFGLVRYQNTEQPVATEKDILSDGDEIDVT